MDEIGILPNFHGYAVHDNWKPYYDYSCKHVLCNAHHLRELTYRAEQYEQKWCKKMEELLLLILSEVEKSKEAGAKQLAPKKLECFTKEFNSILEEGLKEIPELQEQPNVTKKRGKKKQHPTQNLWDRMFKQQKELLT